MPIIGAGDQGWSATVMLESILRNAVAWLNRGLARRVMKIVVYSDQVAEIALRKFEEVRNSVPDAPADPADGFDLFISYCHHDAGPAKTVEQMVRSAMPAARIFYDKQTLTPGNR